MGDRGGGNWPKIIYVCALAQLQLFYVKRTDCAAPLYERLSMSITSALYKLARLSADARAVRRSVETGSPAPILRRLANKAIGRGLVSKLFLRS